MLSVREPGARHLVWLALLALAGSNAAILFTGSILLRYPAALLLLYLLPGWALLGGLRLLHSADRLERLAVAVAVSYALSAPATLWLIYLPGPLTVPQLLLMCDALTLAPLLIGLLRRSAKPEQPVSLAWPSRRALLWLAAILFFAAFFRLWAADYREYHEDEVENLNLALRVIKGEDYALFTDNKGPMEKLIPAALWPLAGLAAEGYMRFPFALAALVGILLAYFLGRRMWGERVGLFAAAFLALNGYLVDASRWVEHIALIFLFAVAALWFLYRFQAEEIAAYAVLGALFVASGLLSHWDGLMLLPVAAFLFLARLDAWRKNKVALIAAALVGGAVLLSFFWPYVHDPTFQTTVTYLRQSRIRDRFLYNRLDRFIYFATLYSTRYYLPFITLLGVPALVREAGRWGRRGYAVLAVLAVAMAAVLLAPSAWRSLGPDLAVLPFALAVLALFLSPRTSLELKAHLLWFATPFIGYCFIAGNAADHLQIALYGLAFIAAVGLDALLEWTPVAWLRVALAVAGSLLALVCGAYFYLQFLAGPPEYYRAYLDSQRPGSWYAPLYGELPRPRELHANPRQRGWKVIGYLYGTGRLSGDFRSVDESYKLAVWYLYDRARSCFEDPQNLVVAVNQADERLAAETLHKVGKELAGRYSHTATVTVEGIPQLYLYERGEQQGQPVTYRLEDYRAAYDATTTPARFVREMEIGHPATLHFGQQIEFLGYDLEKQECAPGGTVELSLYWRAAGAIDRRYRAFVHVENERIWGQHDDDPACRLPTTEWRPGQFVGGQFRITLDPATPPGDYPLIVGLYDPESGARLPVFDAGGQELGDSLTLAQLKVK
jgi:4-amino-4-deoxy-L-arabinose transferase-like glycosyltransferase